MSHTPGPWTVDSTVALGAYGVWTDYAVNPGHDGAGYGVQICSMLPDQNHVSQEARNANARLIAVAPDLLAFVECFLLAGYLERSSKDAEDDARALIAKAKGGGT